MNIDEILDKQQTDLSTRIENQAVEGSGWSVHSVLRHQLVVSDIAPCEGISCFTQPKELSNSLKGLINNQN